jgi:hypothetical protein
MIYQIYPLIDRRNWRGIANLQVLSCSCNVHFFNIDSSAKKFWNFVSHRLCVWRCIWNQDARSCVSYLHGPSSGVSQFLGMVYSLNIEGSYNNRSLILNVLMDVGLQVEVPTSGSETVECGVCQHAFLVSANWYTGKLERVVANYSVHNSICFRCPIPK